jgi:hypothetical protein
MNLNRVVYYVLPEVTKTSDLDPMTWLVERTWFLDVKSIPTLSPPRRRSGDHHLTVFPGRRKVLITSDPVEVDVVNWRYLVENTSPMALGARFEGDHKFGSFAGMFKRNAVGLCLPDVE